MNTLMLECFICKGALPFVPENAQVGDCPAEQFTRAVVDAVRVGAVEGSKAVKVIAPGPVLKVHAAPALNVAPKSSKKNKQARCQR